MSKPANWPDGIPYIDTSVIHVGVSTMRTLNALQLRRLRGPLVIRDNGQPLAVVVPYQTYIEMQERRHVK